MWANGFDIDSISLVGPLAHPTRPQKGPRFEPILNKLVNSTIFLGMNLNLSLILKMNRHLSDNRLGRMPIEKNLFNFIQQLIRRHRLDHIVIATHLKCIALILHKGRT